MSGPRFASVFASALASALCLSACAGPPGTVAGRSAGSYAGPYAGAGGDGGRPLAALPAAAGRVVAVRRIPYANGFGQEIVLDGPPAMSGENVITVQALTTPETGRRGGGAEELRLGPPTDTEVTAEMDRALPGVAMRLAGAPAWGEGGEGGAIGYATGTAGRLSCVYAWQYLAPARPLTLLDGMAGTGALPVSVRVRLCRDRPMAAVVDLLRGLRVSRPDGSVESAATRPLPGGDALSAAVEGAVEGAVGAGAGAVDAPILRSARYEVDAEEPRAGDGYDDAEPARPRRRHLRPAAVRHRAAAPVARIHRRAAFRHALRRTVRATRPDAPEAVRVPRVPMPGDVAAAPTPQTTAPPAPRSAAADAMPMPR